MNINELLTLSNWAISVIDRSSFINSLQSAGKSLRLSLDRNDPREKRRQNLRALLESFQGKLKFIEQDRKLTDAEIEFLEGLGLKTIILPSAIDSYKLALQENGSLESSIHIIEQKLIVLKNAYSHFKQLSEVLSQVSVTISGGQNQEQLFQEGKILTRLRFHDEASISNVVDFERWGKSWHTIGRGFSMLHGYAPEDVEIVSAGKGSILIDLLANIDTINSIGEAINHLLDSVKHLVGIKVAISSLDALSSKQARDAAEQKVYEQMLEQLQSEQESALESNYDNIAKILIDKVDGNPKSVAELRRAIKELDSFIQSGGDIEYIQSPNASDEEKEIIHQLKKVQILLENSRAETKLLSNKAKPDEQSKSNNDLND
ncbi:TPA: hypothetical protein ACVOYS_000658 [Vibrio alginolyticus]